MPEEDKSKLPPIDERQAWIEKHVRTSFKLTEKDLKKLVETDDYKYVSLIYLSLVFSFLTERNDTR